MKSSPATAPAARISYWLLPEPTVRASLQHVIDELAAAYTGPAFVPHMTLAVSAQAAPDAVRQTLAQSAATIAPLLLSPVELQFSPAFTQSCFVQFTRDAELMELAHGFHRREASTATYSFNPHMSLFYGALSAAQRQLILQRVALPQVIQFSELWAIRILNKTASAQDVHDWRVVGKTKLRAAATPPADQNAQTPRER